MQTFTRFFCAAVIVAGWMLTTTTDVKAQYPVYSVPVAPVAPAVVGYAPERRGLFGQRVVYRPVVGAVTAAVPVPVAPVTVARPVIVGRPALPVAVAPAPVTAYYAPAAPVGVPAPIAVPAPVTTYRVPITPLVPVIGW